MTEVQLSLLVLVAQALPGVEETMPTAKEVVAVACALLMVIVVGLWLRLHRRKRK
jgi:hypothetical protein